MFHPHVGGNRILSTVCQIAISIDHSTKNVKAGLVPMRSSMLWDNYTRGNAANIGTSEIIV